MLFLLDILLFLYVFSYFEVLFKMQPSYIPALVVSVCIFIAKHILNAVNVFFQTVLPSLDNELLPLERLSNCSNSRLNRTSCSDSVMQNLRFPKVSLLSNLASS